MILGKYKMKDGDKIIIGALLRLGETLLMKPTDVSAIDAVSKDNNLIPEKRK